MLSKQSNKVSLLSCNVKKLKELHVLCKRGTTVVVVLANNKPCILCQSDEICFFKHYFTNIIYSPFVCPYFCESTLYHILFISPLNMKVSIRYLNETIIITNKQLMT